MTLVTTPSPDEGIDPTQYPENSVARHLADAKIKLEAVLGRLSMMANSGMGELSAASHRLFADAEEVLTYIHNALGKATATAEAKTEDTTAAKPAARSRKAAAPAEPPADQEAAS